MRSTWNSLFCLVASASIAATAEASAPPIPICSTLEETFTATPAVVIPDNTTIETTIEVSGIEFLGQPGAVWDVDLTTFLRHEHPRDIDMTLRSPAGTIVTITTDNGVSFDDVFNGTVWDDSANPGGEAPYTTNAGLVGDHPYATGVLASPLVPEEGLIAFKGENPNGVWTLTIHDDEAQDEGVLDSWSLTITAIPRDVGAPGSDSVKIENQTIPDGGLVVSESVQPDSGTICDMSVALNILHSNSQDLDITLTSPSGKVATITTDNGLGEDNVFAGTRFHPLADLGSQVPYDPGSNPNIVSDHTYTNLVSPEFLTPEESFAVFYGEQLGGTWTLRVSDDTVNSSSGTLVSWTLTPGLCPEPAGDADGDGFDAACELCDDDPLKVQPGVCGCGVPDIDSDSDGVLDCLDECPVDPLKIAAGACGCGIADTDTDMDGLPDCQDPCPADPDQGCLGVDSCPNDPAKTSPGVCGCGVPDVDANANGVIDCDSEGELKARIDDTRKAIRKLKLNRSAKKQRAAKRAAKRSLRELRDFTSGQVFTLSDPSVNVEQLVRQARRNARQALRLDDDTFRSGKRGALRALKKLDNAVVAG